MKTIDECRNEYKGVLSSITESVNEENKVDVNVFNVSLDKLMSLEAEMNRFSNLAKEIAKDNGYSAHMENVDKFLAENDVWGAISVVSGKYCFEQLLLSPPVDAMDKMNANLHFNQTLDPNAYA
ncbi:hypothetical protein SUGI_0195610 [Cryptomeria japonica]|nr:hypothetical protein SUGI_0195610 [Cryptomeria japonica]